MTYAQETIQRDDLDVLGDIEHLIAVYPPSRKDQHAIHVRVRDGHVSLSGHVQTPVTARYLLDTISRVDGVLSVNAERLFDDESARLEVGKALPNGVRVARVQYGAVVLTGSLPDGVSADELTADVSQLPGVARVITSFR